MLVYVLSGLGVVVAVVASTSLWLVRKSSNAEKQLWLITERLGQMDGQREQIERLLETQRESQQEQREKFDAHQVKSLQTLQESLQTAMKDVRSQLSTSLTQQTDTLSKRVEGLTHETSKRLKEISGEVDKRLSSGFEKTNETFNNVMKRLTIIDQAQQKITELSGNVVSLQEVLADRKSRGAFGEVQLTSLVRNMIPEKHFALQHTLSNGKRADCMLFLPEPSGDIAIDAKFPLETYRKLSAEGLSDAERKVLETTFRNDIKKHIHDISTKYIIPGETADGAVMFIPAEAIFAEIHSRFPELVEEAHRARVWLVSPTTMMAILTTARAVLKDAATRKQVHIIQEHLVSLGKDFERFQKRMNDLSRHISQAHQDVELVHKSSQKITGRFQKIEQVELKHEEDALV